ncbi:MraY family glycosyltransferase [Paenarthrobacter sp. Z7-10]|uniref:MraY family glycosyltransferase n=1 Tax=Paenarthrobacter sp. Z7-10 TaxID=2787635 RepID=UPI0022A90E63|nr:glycosyltransferase family 4 protein [Paenarthrobacter sp. Z7-10]
MAALVAGVALVLSLVLPLAFKPWLVRLGVLDIPSERSSHTVPTIRGLGITVALAAAAAMLTALFAPPAAPADRWTLIVCVLVMAAAAAVGWIEDLRGLGIRIRAAVQLGLGLLATAALALLAGGYAYWWIPAGAVAVAAYINVANFMDGINGISGSHGLVVGGFYALAGHLTGHSWLVYAGLAIAGSFAGFLPWNLGRAPVFLGDVGSYLLGGGISVTAVAAFLAGVPVEYIFAPVLIYLADTFVTLIRRIVAGERWYASHRQHAYQRLTIVGLSHLQATAVVSAATVATGMLGLLAADGRPGVSAAAAVGCAVLVLLYLRTPTIFARLIKRRGRRPVGSGLTSISCRILVRRTTVPLFRWLPDQSLPAEKTEECTTIPALTAAPRRRPGSPHPAPPHRRGCGFWPPAPQRPPSWWQWWRSFPV